MSLVRVCTCALVASAAVLACTDAAGPSRTPVPILLASSASSLPIANATVHLIAGLDGATPEGINDSDWVVGYRVPPGALSEAFRWDAKRGVQVLQSLGSSSLAIAVNDVGNTVGLLGAHTVVWLANGNPDIFSLTSDSASDFPPSCGPVGMNKYSVIVGNCNYRDAFDDPVVYPWHAPVQFRLHVNTTFAGISDDGWIAGGPHPDTDDEGSLFVLSPNNALSGLPIHGGPNQATVAGITVHGWATGQDVISTCEEAVAWLAAPHVFRPEFRLGTCGVATGMTPDWYIVGTGTDSTGNNPFAFVWFPGTGLQRLPGLGHAGETSSALKINLAHHVVGTITSGGVQHTVIWDVGPRPTSLVADADSIALIAAVRRMPLP